MALGTAVGVEVGLAKGSELLKGCVGDVIPRVVGVDLGQLVDDLLNSASEIDRSSVGEGFDSPGKGDDGVARDGRVKGEDL